MTYTLDDILRAWKDYTGAKAYCVLRNGKWEEKPLVDGVNFQDKIAGATSAKIRPLKDVMDFPNYLEFYWKG
jgi:hypothetical protein